jgi:hypothetical protein
MLMTVKHRLILERNYEESNDVSGTAYQKYEKSA